MPRRKPKQPRVIAPDDRPRNDPIHRPKRPKKPKNQQGTTTAAQDERVLAQPGPAPAPAPRPAPGPDPDVVRRQRLLRAAGFPVVVDGSWGPRSQSAWQKYRSGVRPLSLSAERRLRVIGAERELRAQLAKVQADAAKLSQAQAIKLREVRRLSTDELKALRRRNLEDSLLPPGARGPIVLDEKSMREVKARVALRRERALAKQLAAAARRKRPEQMSLDELVALTVDPLTGELDPQNRSDVVRIQRWLQAHGHPNLETDGVFGPATFESLRDSYFSAKRREEASAQQRLVEHLYTIKALRPGDVLAVVGANASKEDVLRVLRAGGFSADILWKQIAELSRDRAAEFLAWREQEALRLGKIAFGPFAKSLFPSDPVQTLRAVQMATGDRTVGTIATADSFFDLRVKLAQLAAADRALHEAQVKRAEQGGSFWGGALHALTWAGHEFRKGTMEEAAFVELLVTDPGKALAPLVFMGDEDYNEELERRGQEINAAFHDEFPVGAFYFDVLADPINVAPGAGAIGRGGVWLERLGYAINAEQKLVPTYKAAFAGRAALALTLPARGTRYAGFAARGAVGAYVPSAFGRAVTSLKGEAISRARTRATLLLAHHFTLEAGVDLPKFTVKGKVLRAIAAATPEAELQSLNFLSYIYKTFREGRLSFYANLTREVRSNVGEGVLANAAEYIRVVEVERRAVLEAQAQYELLIAHTGNEAKAIRAATDAYKAYKERAGSYLIGASHPAFREVEDVVQMKLSRLRDVIFPLLQNRLMRELDEVGETLFDDAGRWLGRGGAEDSVFRAMGRDAFGDPARTVKVANPIQGQTFTQAEAFKLQEQEIARRVGRTKGWASRQGAAGRPIAEADLTEKVQKIKTEVESAWERKSNGEWIDGRDWLEVPDIYARQMAELYKNVPASEIPESIADVVAQLPKAPAETAGSELQVELRSLAWAFGGPDEFDEIAPILGNVLEALRPVGFDGEAAAAFRGSIDNLANPLGKAWARTYAQSLRQNYALWRAFAEAEGKLGRVAYTTVSGGLQAWIFLTLPFRPGWAFRNIVDNTAKVLMAGVRDPRIFFLGGETPGSGVRTLVRGRTDVSEEGVVSFFSLGLDRIGFGIMEMDRLFGTNVSAGWFQLVDSLWAKGSDVMEPIFRAHNLPVPKSVIDDSTMRAPWETSDVPLRGSAKVPGIADKSLQARLAGEEVDDPNWFRRFQNGMWELMATRPESYYKRMLYRDSYYKALNRHTAAGMALAEAEKQAFIEAWQAVEKHLFDYSKESVLEDNLRLVFPFVQFWRKNTMLWAEHFVNKPWLPAKLVQFEEALHEEINVDLPSWTRRYINSSALGNGVSRVPGLAWLGGYLASLDVMYDPLNYFSFAPLYRGFKNENPHLPADKLGLPFIAPMVDAMNEWGLSMNPLIRKPLESAGVFNFRAWQAVFPQTPIIQAFTRKYLNDRFPDGLNVESLMFDPLFGTPTNEQIAAAFNEYVQLEMANQAVRGEPVDRAKAEKRVQDFFLVQSIFGYFSGAYLRRMTPEDFYLAKLAESFYKGEADYRELSEKDKRAYRLYKFRKIDRVEFDRYVASIPLIQAYYKLGDWKMKERYKQEHPEIIPWVEPLFAGKGVNSNYVQTAALVQDTAWLKEMTELADDLDLPESLRDVAEQALVTPELRAFWDRSTTPKERRDRHLRLLYHRHLKRLSDQYFEIPETDYDARSGYLKQHPILGHWWLQNDQASDEYLALINHANSDLREVYFEHADRGDWDSADRLLHKYPFIFEFTKAADRVDDDGNWIAKFSGTKTLHFGRGRRRFGLSEHARDYLSVKGLLDAFFGMKTEFDRQAWLEHNGKDQRRVLAYFRKWGSKDGQSEHARAFAEAKPSLDIYFGMPKRRRKEWLNGDSKEAAIALAYFKRWSKMNYMARLWAKMPESKNPELRRRIKFWHTYFSLPPNERPAYAVREAERHGVYIYGPLGRKEREERESEYLRKLYAHGVSKRAAYYLYVKPLLDAWHKLKTRADKQLFLRTNPELTEYLDEFSSGLATGDKKLDKLLQGYFELPDRSPLRSAYLKQHPQVQDYFDEHSSPAERAIHRLLEVYFRVPLANRKVFLLDHPEIRAYFDERKRQQDLARGQAEVFAENDPRLAAYRDEAAIDIVEGAELLAERDRMRRARRHRVEGIETRRERR